MSGDGFRGESLVEGYELEFAEDFDGQDLDPGRWLPAHLPHWSSRAQAAARYRLQDGRLVLEITAAQEPWCPEFDGATRVSSLQTGVYSGAAGSVTGQHRFRPDVVVREPQPETRLYTPRHGYFEVRMAAIADPRTMVAFWMIGFEDAPHRSGEICICEIFGRDVGPRSVRVGIGVHPFADPRLVDDFDRVPLELDATAFHVYGAEWTRDHVAFFVDGRLVKTVGQSPDYPMQFMLGIYEFDAGPQPRPPGDETGYPKEFVVDHVRGYRPVATASERYDRLS